ncbi:MAG: isoleucine--tRNA ligase, partial [Alistipes sp.]|nr:isoleucine--tRNA ligase [Alistipes sp.]
YGKYMKQIAALVATFSQEQIAEVESGAVTQLEIDGALLDVAVEDFDITSEDMPGWLVASEGKLTVALDITVTDELRKEGVARELVNRIQNIRKESGLEVTDKISVEIEAKELVEGAVAEFGDYIGSQTLAVSVKCSAEPEGEFVVESDIDEDPLRIAITKMH